MKVNNAHRVGLEKMQNHPMKSPQKRAQFGRVVQEQTQRLGSNQMTRLLSHITVAGERLANSRRLRDLAKFKMLVRRFLKEAVEGGFELEQSHTWNQFGEGRRLNLVKEIDEKLVQLAEDILDEEQSSVDLLARVGEIKGLLINLYM